MAYTPTVWETGDVITAQKLNKMENGIAGINGVLSITVSDSGDDSILSATWQEINDAIENHTPVFVFVDGNTTMPQMVYATTSDDGYEAILYDISVQTLMVYSCESADDFPIYSPN